LEESLAQLLARIKEYQPGLIGISVNSHQFIHAREIAREIKKISSALIVVGGVHVTLFPEALEKEESFDGICIGEGETAFLELANKLQAKEDYFGIKNFWFRRGKEIIKNECAKLIENLDDLPFPDRSIFRYFQTRKTITPRFIFSRGCPFNCTYCCNHALKRKYAGLGPYLRFRSVDRAIEEIRALKQNYEFSHLKLDDDTFSFNKAWLLEFCNKFPKNFDMTFECNVRPGSVDEESLIALKKGGCNLIKVGVETGNEELRKNVLNRNISNQETINLFDQAKKIGLKTYSFNMIGIPGETKKSIRETIDLNVHLKPDFMQITIFYPYFGTILGDKCLQEGLIENSSLDSYLEKSILRLSTISKREIEKQAKNFKFNVYKHYDLKKAFSAKQEQLREFISSKFLLSVCLRPLYRLIKKADFLAEK
jgi:radical SAM superfamily enzyme YgiQ (UPF0313 family)